MSLLAYIFVFSILGGVVSLVGGIIVVWRGQKSSKIFAHLLSFAAGTMLGAAMLDLLPEAVEMSADASFIMRWVLYGFTFFFVMEGFFRWLYHTDAQNEHNHIVGVVKIEGGHHDLSHTPPMLVIGDTIHNFLDGVAIAAAFLVSVPLGIITTFAVAMHEIPQEISDMTVMLTAGWSRTNVIFWNVASAMAATVGALATFFARNTLEPFVVNLLALTAGFFLYVSASDLIPELYRVTRRDKMSHAVFFFLVGLVVVGVLVRLAHNLE